MNKLNIRSNGLEKLLGISDDVDVNDDIDNIQIMEMSIASSHQQYTSNYMGASYTFPGIRTHNEFSLTLKSKELIFLSHNSLMELANPKSDLVIWADCSQPECMMFHGVYISQFETNVDYNGGTNYEITILYNYHKFDNVYYEEPIEKKLEKLGL